MGADDEGFAACECSVGAEVDSLPTGELGGEDGAEIWVEGVEGADGEEIDDVSRAWWLGGPAGGGMSGWGGSGGSVVVGCGGGGLVLARVVGLGRRRCRHGR